jgi:hypothetical protein
VDPRPLFSSPSPSCRKQACKLKIAPYSDFVIKSLLRYYYYHAIIYTLDRR